MKVKITHTIDLDEVPSFVQDILSECGETLRACASHRYKSMVGGITNFEKFTHRLNQLRADLASVDNKLEECANIMNGYNSATSENLEDPPVSAEDSEIVGENNE
jgi:hypothetical protein